ncbi:guanylate kinase [Pseudaquidulcibacter saccharophilus]|uniref:guanylate kinase n=1 Tax=Pseudaquidulcibacter saccharophilus TaxID=2831900 RepID=UPI001EFF3BC8|nr:guanylate kinase [Pseudaquidulcibacter saccharophilus]
MENGTMVKRRGLMLVLSSPSGTGKTTLSRRLVAEDDDLSLSVSCTTRSPRVGEGDGEHYHFISKDEFREIRAKDGFLEWAEVHDNYYGSPKEPIMKALESGRDIIFDIDWQGAQQLEKNAPKDVVSVFILPPSMNELRRRLTDRAQDSLETIKKRMNNAYGEIARAETYDYILVNDDLDATYEKLKDIIKAERLSRYRQPWVHSFVQQLLSEDT